MKYFKLEEFKCPCCGEVHMDDKFLSMLDLARTIAGIPFVITSGYRCKKHNKEIGGVPDSAHTKGLASDIRVNNSIERYMIVISLLQAGFNRIGIGSDFIHVDCDESKPQYVIWTYYDKKWILNWSIGRWYCWM